jgi:hypothetical protein
MALSLLLRFKECWLPAEDSERESLWRASSLELLIVVKHDTDRHLSYNLIENINNAVALEEIV